MKFEFTFGYSEYPAVTCHKNVSRISHLLVKQNTVNMFQSHLFLGAPFSKYQIKLHTVNTSLSQINSSHL